MDQRVRVGGLQVAESLHRFIVEEALPGTGVDPETFWKGADSLVHDLTPRNRELLARREDPPFDEGDLWSDVLDRKGGGYTLLARMPEDPSLN